MSLIFSIESVFDFERKCLERNREIMSWIDEKLQFMVPVDESRERLLVFYKQMVKSFVDNSEFIFDSLQKNGNLEPLANITRTIIELFCRAMYLNKVGEKEKLKKVLACDLYSLAMCEMDNQGLACIIEECQDLAQSPGITLPTVKELKEWIKVGIYNLGQSKELHKFRQNFFFPSVKQMIREHLDEKEEPQIPKRILYGYYSMVSDQIHGNPYLAQHIPCRKPTNRILALLITLSLRFLKEISALTNFPMEKVDSLILSWQKYFKNGFVDLWILSTHSR